MRHPFYLRQLRKDIELWVDKGWVHADNKDNLLATAGTSSQTRILVPTLIIIGALLVGLGFLSFIAANWSGLSKVIRLALLLGALWTTFALAIWLRQKSPLALEGAALLGALLFGVNIMFIAQTYNISAHYPDGIMLWAAGALLTALLTPSRAALTLGFCLLALATVQESIHVQTALHLKFFLLWLPMTGMAVYLNWRPGHHLAALSLIIWLFCKTEFLVEILTLGGLNDLMTVMAAVSLLFMTAGLKMSPPQKRHSILFVYGYVLLLGFSFALHSFDEPMNTPLALTLSALGAAIVGPLAWLAVVQQRLRRLDAAVLTAMAFVIPLLACFQAENSQVFLWIKHAGYMGLVVWALSFGAARHDRSVINLALIALGAEILFVYFSTFGSLLGNAAFFAISGVVFIASAFGLEKLRRNLSGTDVTRPAEIQEDLK